MSDPTDSWELLYLDDEEHDSSSFYNAASDGERVVAVGYWDTSSPSFTYGPMIVVADEVAGPYVRVATELTDIYFNDVAYGDGIWCAVGPNDDNDMVIYTAVDPSSTWSLQATFTPTNAFSGFGEQVLFGDGLWVVAGGGGADIYTATDPTGTWTFRADLASDHGDGFTDALGFFNGTWVVLYSTGTDCKILTNSNPVSSAWVESSVIEGSYLTLGYSLGSTNDGYFIATYEFDSDQGPTRSRIYTASSLSGPWTERYDFADDYSGSFAIVFLADGDWVAGGADGDGKPSIWAGSSPDGPFAKSQVESDDQVGQASYLAPSHTGQDWFAAGYRGEGYGYAAIWAPPASGGGEGWGLLL